MAKLFPFRPESQHESAGPRLVNLDDEVADDVFAALSSDTAREILSRLYRDPATASDVAEAADTSLQNARYHLDKLESAGLIEPIDTWYSSRGTEMTVYAPTNEPLVVAAGREESKGVLRRALERVVGAVTVLALASVVVDRLVRRFGGPTAVLDPGEGGGSPTKTDRYVSGPANDTPTETIAATGAEARNAAETATPVPMGTTTEQAARTPAQMTPEGTHTTTPASEATRGTVDTAVATRSTTPTTETVTNTSTSVAEMATGGVDLLSGVPPGGLFFAGGLLVVLLVAAWWYWGQYRPMYG